jgi:hypothetical protein
MHRVLDGGKGWQEVIPLWQAFLLIGVTITSALVTGLAFYLAGRRYQAAQQHRDTMLSDARDQSSRTYSTMEGTLHRMSERLDALEKEGDKDRQRIMALSNRVQALEDGIAILMRQIRNAGMEPDWKPDDTVIANVPVNLSSLIDRIYQRFNDEELGDLARRIGIGPDDIPGETLKRRATELVEMAQRQGLTGHLIAVCKELRPRSNW